MTKVQQNFLSIKVKMKLNNFFSFSCLRKIYMHVNNRTDEKLCSVRNEYICPAAGERSRPTFKSNFPTSKVQEIRFCFHRTEKVFNFDSTLLWFFWGIIIVLWSSIAFKAALYNIVARLLFFSTPLLPCSWLKRNHFFCFFALDDAFSCSKFRKHK